MSLYKNSPVRFQAIGSVDTLHLTTPGVEKKNDHVIAKVPIPINEPSADRNGTNAPAARRTAVVNSIMPSRSASPLIPKIDSHETNGLLEMYNAIPSADWSVNFCMPNEMKIRTITHRRMPSSQYEPSPFSETLKLLIMIMVSLPLCRQATDRIGDRPGCRSSFSSLATCRFCWHPQGLLEAKTATLDHKT